MRIARGIFWGGLIGSLILAPDGALVGLFVGDVVRGTLAGALAGAILGAIVGAIAALAGPRMILPPPAEDGEREVPP